MGRKITTKTNANDCPSTGLPTFVPDALLMEKVFNSIPMPVFVKDRAHRWIILNDAMCALQEKKREELLGKNDYDFFPREQAEEFWAKEEAIFESRGTLFLEEFSLRNGRESIVVNKKTIISGPNDELFLVGCSLDITERKKAELALEESERRFRSLVQYSPDFIAILERNLTIRYITPSFFRSFEYPEAQVLGQSILPFVHEEDRALVKERIEAILHQPETGASLSFRVRKENGEMMILESFFKNLLDYPAVGGIVMNSSDITELRNQADEIRRMNLLLERDNSRLKVDLKNEVKARVDHKAVDLEEFKKIYPDDEACLQYLASLKWNDAYQCRKCGHRKFSKGKLVHSRRCTLCGYDESPMHQTIFGRVKFPLIKAFYMVFLVSSQRKTTAKQLSQLLSLRKDTCGVFKRKLLQILKQRKGANKLNQGWESLLLLPGRKTSSAKPRTARSKARLDTRER